MTEKQENYGAAAQLEPNEHHLAVLADVLRITQERTAADPTADNIGALLVAKKALDEALAPPASVPAEKTYKNVKEAVAELKRRGYGVEKSKVYKDAGRGLLRKQADKSITESALSDYIANPAAHLTKPTDVSADDLSRMSGEKLMHETELAREQARERRRKNDMADGLLMPRDRVFMELAGRAAVFELGIKHAVAVRLPEILDRAAAIPDKTARQQFVQRELHHMIDAQMNEYANTRTFKAMVVEEEIDAVGGA